MQFFSKNERFLAALYFVWFFIHLGLFFSSEESVDSNQFWPFIQEGKTLSGTYDVVEFLVYAGFPLVLFIAYKIVTYNPILESSEPRRHSTGNFFLAFLDEKIKTEELKQKINELTDEPVDFSYLNELKNDREKAATQGVNRWLDRMEVKKKYKEFETVS